MAEARHSWRWITLIAATLCGSGLGFADESDYTTKVLPLLKARCYSCHSHAARKTRGGLAVDSRDALLAGGDTGPAIIAGQPGASLLIDAVKRNGLEMPPSGKGEPLTVSEIAILEQWIQAGAHAPASIESSGPKKRRPGPLTEADKRWWAMQPLSILEVPPLANEAATSVNEIDRFIQDRQRGAGLSSSPQASFPVLARRVTFDLIGLPPRTDGLGVNPVNKTSPSSIDAEYEQLVDTLLASPQFGERMARHWLDLVRYADSDGYRLDEYRPDAWRYRDYVIQSFNSDKPYDRFVQEQLAGDELFPGDPDALIATGYLRHWIYEYNNRDVRAHWSTILNDITDTTADVFLGVGLQCARCHDHKFDPILQRDYYRLQAFFAPLLPRDDQTAVTESQRAAHAIASADWFEKTAMIRAEIAALEQPYRDKAADGAVSKFPPDIQGLIRKPASDRSLLETQLAALAWRQVDYEFARLDNQFKGEAKERLLALRRQLAEFDKLKPAPLPIAFAVSDIGPISPPLFIPKKGEAPIEPGVLSLLNPDPAIIELPSTLSQSTGRRATLARWLTRPDNPLTARVIVNRVWQQHFGRGLAANASDFGSLGEPPSHPELLDWLAAWFTREGGSLKKLHRLIVTSATYKQSSLHPEPEQGRLIDPENKLLWRFKPRRLEAEQIRDAIFSVTGELKIAPAGGPGVAPTEPRRSIYTRMMRNARDPLIDAFDAPLWFTSAPARDTTTTPVQSLLLVNSPFLLQRSKLFAVHLQQIAPHDESQQIEAAYRLAYGRIPTPGEIDNANKFLSEQISRVNVQLATSAQASFTPEKIPYRDGQAALIEPAGTQRMFRAVHSSHMQPAGDFTLEAFILPRSIAEDGTVRVIASKWNGDMKLPGWSFGITGKGSRRKPQTVVLQCIGRKRDGTTGEVIVFSDQHVALNKPYFIAVAVKLATTEASGVMTFFLKDLSNDDEPLLTANIEHDLAGGLENEEPFTIGGRNGRGGSHFHGAIDDVRFSRGAIDAGQLLFNAESVASNSLGYWRFEAKPDVLHDSTEHRHHLEPATAPTEPPKSPRVSALEDFCHALLNSSEFLYVE